jgi:hypothetical protein
LGEIFILGILDFCIHLNNLYEYNKILKETKECRILTKLILKNAQISNELPYKGVCFYTEWNLPYINKFKEIISLQPNQLNMYNDLLLQPRNNIIIKKSLKNGDGILWISVNTNNFLWDKMEQYNYIIEKGERDTNLKSFFFFSFSFLMFIFSKWN